MAKWFAPIVLDNGLSHIVAATTYLHLLKAYTAGDSFNTVTVTNSLGNVLLAGGDKVLGNQGVNGREIAVASKTITGAVASGATPNLHVAIVDGTTVLAVTDETSDQEIFNGNNVNVPAFKIKMNQPV